MSSPTVTSGMTTSYWCYSCTRLVSLWSDQDSTGVACPYCDGGFIEEIPGEEESVALRSENHGRRFPNRRARRRAGHRFNPVIALRGPGDGDEVGNGNNIGAHAFEFFYDDGSGSGLRPLPESVSEFLMGSGFDRLLDQLSRIDSTDFGRPDNPPASKAAIESMPTIQISDFHISAEACCAVCTEAFEPGAEASELPCKHIYHRDCIIPWLSIRNSCPVCRFELPADLSASGGGAGEEEAVGMTIWRLPGGGFAVGRFTAGRGNADRVLPVVLTEMDGVLSATDAPRRVSWLPERFERAGASGGSGGFRRVARRLVSLMRRFRSSTDPSPSSSSSSSSFSPPSSWNLGRGSESASMNRSFSRSNSMFGRLLRSGRSSRESGLE